MTSLVFAFTIQDVLAIRLPVDGNILVVEGWIWNSPAMREAAEEFNRGHYKYLVTIGRPVEGNEDLADPNNSAELAARRLRQFGIAQTHITVLSVPNVTLHRTYASALALRSWLSNSKIETTGVNVVTLGAHARKSLYYFNGRLDQGRQSGLLQEQTMTTTRGTGGHQREKSR